MEHVCALVEAFDIATLFGVSFGITKFQLAQVKAKLVGEVVGRDGRGPDPARIKAIRSWPPVTNLKQLQELLGATSYTKPQPDRTTVG